MRDVRSATWRASILLIAALAVGCGSAQAPAPATTTAAEATGANTDPTAEARRARARGQPVSSDLAPRGFAYNSEYIFGLSKGLAAAPITPVVKPLLFILTVPADVVLLPPAIIGGFFG